MIARGASHQQQKLRDLQWPPKSLGKTNIFRCAVAFPSSLPASSVTPRGGRYGAMPRQVFALFSLEFDRFSSNYPFFTCPANQGVAENIHILVCTVWRMRLSAPTVSWGFLLPHPMFVGRVLTPIWGLMHISCSSPHLPWKIRCS